MGEIIIIFFSISKETSWTIFLISYKLLCLSNNCVASFMSPFPTIALSLLRVIASLPGESAIKLLISSSDPETIFALRGSPCNDGINKPE